MQVQISVPDGTPIYQQLVEQVEPLVTGGRLQPGERDEAMQPEAAK
jgi:DNA-binding transcriptional regulator YhcF (GntR family)